MKTTNRQVGGVGLVLDRTAKGGVCSVALGLAVMVMSHTAMAAEVEVVLSAVPTVKNQPDAATAMDFGAYSMVGLNLSIGGNSEVLMSNGMIHANNNIDLNGNVKVTGLISACNAISGTKNPTIITGNASAKSYGSKIQVTGTKTVTNVATYAAWPTVPLDYYRSIAQANSRYYTGDVKWNKANADANAPGGVVPGGVIYVQGGTFEFTPETTVALKACIVAEKGIKWNAGDLIAPAGFPAMVVTEPLALPKVGLIDIGAGSRVLSGLLYSVNGNVEVNGSGSIYGQIFAKKDIIFRGTPDAIVYSNCVDVLVQGAQADKKAIVTAWEK